MRAMKEQAQARVNALRLKVDEATRQVRARRTEKAVDAVGKGLSLAVELLT